MSTLAIVGLVAQLLCAIHAAALRRPGLWRWVVLGVPFIGSLAYAAMEIWGALIRRRRDRMLADGGVDDRAHPAVGENAAGLAARAAACLRAGDAKAAIELFAAALGQSRRREPALMLGLANGYFAAGEFGRCLQTLDALESADPKFEPGRCQALAARCRDRLGRRQVA